MNDLSGRPVPVGSAQTYSGRVVDLMVAEKIMGYHVIDRANLAVSLGFPHAIIECPFFSAVDCEAVKVLRAMQERGYEFAINSRHENNANPLGICFYATEFVRAEPMAYQREYLPDFALSVCVNALKVLGLL